MSQRRVLRRARLVVAVTVGLVFAVLPQPGQAAFEPPGLNGAQLDLSNDNIATPIPEPVVVTGKKFAPNALANIFFCPAGATDLMNQCVLRGTAQTDAGGGFSTELPLLRGVSPETVLPTFVAPNGTSVTCRTYGPTQCAMAAATYDSAVPPRPTAQAEHYVCFRQSVPGLPPAVNHPCIPRSAASTTTTTAASTTTSTATTTTTAPTTTTSTTTPPHPSCSVREAAVQHSYTALDPGPNVGGDTLLTSIPAWQPANPTGERPPPRESAALAYDAAPNRKKTVLFGGFNRGSSNCVLGDTWTWDGSAWAKQNPAHSPPARYGAVMAFDGTNVVLFGGYDGANDLADTWIWDGSDWTRQEAPGPSARSRSVMAYLPADAQHPNQAVLFGGDEIAIQDGKRTGRALGDTWVWDGGTRTWAQRTPAQSPGPRAYAAMTYHPGKGVVLHGGWNGHPHNQTWTFDGVTWTLRNGGSTGNSPFVLAGAMAFHGASGTTQLQSGMVRSISRSCDSSSQGGCLGEPPGSGNDGVWDGTGWATVGGPVNVPVNPPLRAFPVMAEDALGHLVFFGGYGFTSNLATPATETPADQADTWILGLPAPPVTIPPTTVTVPPLPTTLPVSTTLPTVTSTSLPTVTSVTVPSVTTLTLPPVVPTVTVPPVTTTVTLPPVVPTVTVPPVTTTVTLPPPPVSLTTTTFPLPTTTELPPTTVTVPPVSTTVTLPPTTGLPPTTVTIPPGTTSTVPPTTLPVTTVVPTSTTTTTKPPQPGCRLREAQAQHTYQPPPLEIGQGAPSFLAVDPVWMPESPARSPRARDGAAMAYDPVQKQTVLFGGFARDATTGCVLGDTWIWDGTASTWTPQSPVVSPPARYGHVLAYDGTGLVLFGGNDGTSDLADTWTWNGAERTWTKRETPAAPSPRARSAMAYDQERHQAVLFGGDHDAKTLDDTWTWDGRTKAWTRQAPIVRPGPRGYASMSYHPGTKEVVLQGGWNGYTLMETWAWNGTTWRLRAAGNTGSINGTDPTTGETSYAPRTHSGAMGLHPSTGLVVYQAGGSERLGEGSGGSDGVWDGSGWGIPVQSAGGPPPRAFPAMAEDSAGHLVFFGGFGYARTQLGNDGSCVIPGVCLPSVRGEEADQADTWRLITPGTFAAPNGEEQMTVTVDPIEIPANGTSTATVTATVSRAGTGQPGYSISFATDGDVTISPPSGTTGADGKFSATVTASRTPGFETITATAIRPAKDPVTYTPPWQASTVLTETGIRVTLDPPSVAADGTSTSVATATVYKPGALTGERVCFTTSGDVTFSSPGPPYCGNRTGERTWTITIRASNTPGQETITAHAVDSNLTGSAMLEEGGSGWVERTPPPPASLPGREEAAMAYDAARKVTVLFGGTDGTKVLGDTWLWDGTSWAQVKSPNGDPIPGPSPRRGPAMAFDASSGKVLLFGGHDGTNYLGDTWTWDGTAKQWTQQLPAQSPSPRYVANMAPDGVGVLLFSGTAGWAVDNNGPTDPNGPGNLRDTWVWRNGTWANVTPGPAAPPPTTASKDFESRTPIVVPLPPPPPGCPGLGCPADKADPYPSSISVTGMSGTVARVTVTLRDLSWTHYGPADADIMLVAPGGRGVMLMSDVCGTTDNPNPIARDAAVTLTFDDRAPTGLSAAGPCTPGTYRPANVQTHECTPFHSPDAFSSPAPPGAGSASLADFMGTDPNGQWQLYVVDDCPNDTDPLGEAGRIQGGWALKIETTEGVAPPPTPATSPPPRGRAAIGYHAATNKVVLFGGTQEFQLYSGSGTAGAPTTAGRPFNPLGDTWIWNGSTWSQEGAGQHPQERRAGVMAYHPGTGQLLLFGGSPTRFGTVADPRACPSTCATTDEPLADTWTWNGTSWARQPSLTSPPGGHLAAMASDPAGRVVLVAGGGSSASTWTWDSRVRLALQSRAVSANGRDTTEAVATVTASNGQPIDGLSVEFSTDGDAVVSGPSARGGGVYAASVTASSTPGLETITVRTPLGSATTTLEEVGLPCSMAPAATAGGSWRELAGMPTPRLELGAALGGDGRIYTFGGRLGFDATAVSTVEAYDPCTNTWQTLPSMPGGARANVAVAAGADGRIFVVGGTYGPRGEPTTLDVTEVYTPGAGATPGRWETLPRMPTTRMQAAATVAPDGDLYVTGGQQFGNRLPEHNLDTLDVYSPRTGRWTPNAHLLAGRKSHASTTDGGGTVLAIGGAVVNPGSPVATATNTVEAFDKATGTWGRAAPMTTPRAAFGATLGPDGLVYAAGGVADSPSSQGSRQLGSVEAYITCTGSWVPVAPMPQGRSHHAVVTGPDGRIYALGGRVGPAVDGEAPGGLNGTSQNAVTSGSVQAYAVDARTTDNVCPKVSVDDVRVLEPSSGTATARFTVKLDRPPAGRVRVSFETQDGSAKAGNDYTATSGTVEFGVDAGSTGPSTPGGQPPSPDPSQTETSRTVDVTVLADSIPEGQEFFRLRLTLLTPRTAAMGRDSGIATIADGPPSGSTTSTSSTTTTTLIPGPTLPSTTTSVLSPSTSYPPPTVPPVSLPELPSTTTLPTVNPSLPTTTVTTIALPTTTTLAVPPVSVPDVTLPPVSIPDTTLPTVPVTPPTGTTVPTIPDVTLPPTTLPTGPDVTLPTTTVPSPVSVPEVTVPPANLPPTSLPTTPGVTAPPVTTPPVTAPPVTTPPVTAPPVTPPDAALPPVSMPPVTSPPAPALTIPPVTAPPVRVDPPMTPTGTIPPVPTSPVSIPTADIPPMTVPPISPPVTAPLPPVTAPPVTLPPISVPPVTTPLVTLPPVTAPPVTLPPGTLPPVTPPVVNTPPAEIPVPTLPPVNLNPGPLPLPNLGGGPSLNPGGPNNPIGGGNPTGGGNTSGGTNPGGSNTDTGNNPATNTGNGSGSGNPSTDPSGGTPGGSPGNTGNPVGSPGNQPGGSSPVGSPGNTGNPVGSPGNQPGGSSPVGTPTNSGNPVGSPGGDPGGSSPVGSPTSGTNAGAEAGTTPATPQTQSAGQGATQAGTPPLPQGQSSAEAAGSGATPPPPQSASSAEGAGQGAPPPPQGQSASAGEGQGVVAPGAGDEPERDPEVAPEVAWATEPDPYLASGRRPDPVPPAAMAWGAALAVAALGWGLRRRGSRRPAPAPAWARTRRRH